MPFSDDPFDELANVAGRHAQREIKILNDAIGAYEEGRERDAIRIVKPLYEKYPEVLAVQELYGMCLYSNGKYKQAKKVLEDFAQKSGSYDQHPMIMDCYRAEKDFAKVDELWSELGSVSPSGSVVAEGRIVHSQSLAERGQIAEALKQLRKKVKPMSRPKEHNLRLWYCLADLEERAGNIIAARQWFERIDKVHPQFADVNYRLGQL